MRKYWYCLSILLLMIVLIVAFLLIVVHAKSAIKIIGFPNTICNFIGDDWIKDKESDNKFENFINDFNHNNEQWDIQTKIDELINGESYLDSTNIELFEIKQVDKMRFVVQIKLQPEYIFIDGNTQWISQPINFTYLEHQIPLPLPPEIIRGHVAEFDFEKFVINFNNNINYWNLPTKINEIFGDLSSLNIVNTRQISIEEGELGENSFHLNIELNEPYFFNQKINVWSSPPIEFAIGPEKAEFPYIPANIQGRANEFEISTFINNFNHELNGWTLLEKINALGHCLLKEEHIKNMTVFPTGTEDQFLLTVDLTENFRYDDNTCSKQFAEKVSFSKGPIEIDWPELHDDNLGFDPSHDSEEAFIRNFNNDKGKWGDITNKINAVFGENSQLTSNNTSRVIASRKKESNNRFHFRVFLQNGFVFPNGRRTWTSRSLLRLR